MMYAKRLGIEIEFFFKSKQTLNLFDNFMEKNIMHQLKKDVFVKLSREYYRHMMELSFDIPSTLEGIKSVKNTILKMPPLDLSRPDIFCGLHVHFFYNKDIKKKNASYEREKYFLHKVYKKILEKEFKVSTNSLHRFIRGHHFLGLFNWYYNHGYVDKVLQRNAIKRTYYNALQSDFNKQYSVIRYSPSRSSGKKTSIEVRALSNDFLFMNDVDIFYNFVKELDSDIYNYVVIGNKDFPKIRKQNIGRQIKKLSYMFKNNVAKEKNIYDYHNIFQNFDIEKMFEYYMNSNDKKDNIPIDFL